METEKKKCCRKKKFTSKDFNCEDLICNCYDLEKYMRPFWKGNIVYNETVFPITDENGEALPLNLFYDATEIVSVKNYTLDTTYEAGVDYVLEDGVLKVLPEGRIKVVDNEYMHPSENPENKPVETYYPHRNGQGFEYWNENNEISHYCVNVTYIHNDTWHSVVPKNISNDIPKTMAKLRNKECLNLVVLGDSVSAGAKASLYCHCAPYCDAYPLMLAKYLETKFGGPINLVNKAIGGTISTLFPDMIKERVIDNNPDTVIIAYGMNDSSHERKGIPDETFRQNILDHISFIRESKPECEFILVASVYGNTTTFPGEKYESHAQILHEIAAEVEGVAVCDPQEIERPLFADGRKKFLDVMSDNMVHPNDFGMRLIAQTIAEAIGD